MTSLLAMSCFIRKDRIGVLGLQSSLWIESSLCSGLPCNTSQHCLKLIYSLIDQIEVPSEITCLPRGIYDHLKNWKGACIINYET